MGSRPRRRGEIYAIATLTIVALAYSAVAQVKDKEKQDQGSMLQMRIEITAGEKSAPVDMASVYVRYVVKHALGKEEKIEMNFKSNKDGVVVAPALPRGKVLVQVVADGWKPFGDWFDLNEDGQTVKIKLEKPPKWY